MKLVKANIVTGRGMDKVSLETDLDGPFPGEKLSLEFTTPKGDAVGYVASTFPSIDIGIIDVSPNVLANRMGKDAVVHFAVQRRPDLENGCLVSSSIVSSRLVPTIGVPETGRDAQAPEPNQAGPCQHTRLLDQPERVGKLCVDCNQFFDYRDLALKGH